MAREGVGRGSKSGARAQGSLLQRSRILYEGVLYYGTPLVQADTTVSALTLPASPKLPDGVGEEKI
jgi:hypothetical protein